MEAESVKCSVLGNVAWWFSPRGVRPTCVYAVLPRYPKLYKQALR